MNIKNVSFYLFTLFFSSIFSPILFAMQQKSAEQAVQAVPQNIEDIEKIVSGIFEKDLDQDKNEEASFLDFFNRPTKMAEKLPEGYRDKVVNCWEDCQHLFLKLQHPTRFLFDVSQDIGIKAQELSAQQSNMNLIIEALHKVQEFLGNQNFQGALQFGFFPEIMKNNLAEISEKLNDIYKKSEEGVFGQLEESFKQDLQVLHDCFEALKIGNVAVVVCYKQKYLQSELEKVVEELKLIEQQIEELKSNAASDDKDLQKAIEFWQDALQEFDVLKAFGKGNQGSSFTQKINSSLFSGLEKISPFILGGYGFYRKFTDLYKNDHKGAIDWSWKNLKQPQKLAFLVGDQAVRISMVPLYFLKRFAQIRNSDVNPLMQRFLLQQIIVELWGVYADPNFFIKTEIWPFRSLYRIGPAYAYNILPKFYDHYMNNKKFEGKWWPSDDTNFKKALWFSFKDGYKTFGTLLEREIERRADPEILRKLNDSTLGIINPGLISFILNTGMPLLAYDNSLLENVAQLKKHDVFMPEFAGENLFDWNYVGKKPCVEKFRKEKNKDGKTERVFDRYEYQDDAYFLEGRILGYLSLNMGSYFGKKLASRYKRPIKSVLAGSTNRIFKFILTSLNIIDENETDAYKAFRDQATELLKFLFEDGQDPLLAMARQIFFSFFINMGFMTQLEVAKIEEDATKGDLNKEQVEQIVDKVVSSVADTIVIGIGGYVGSTAAWLGANYAMHNYGPFYPKIKQKGGELVDRVSGWWSAPVAGA